MTFYELTNSMTIQGNIEVVVYDNYDCNNPVIFDRREVLYCDGLCCADLDYDYDDCEVLFIYPSKTPDGEALLIVELELGAEED